MHRIAAFCLTLVAGTAALGLSSCVAADLSQAELRALGLEVRWTGQAVLDVRRDVVRHVSNDESNIYLQSSGGMLTVLHAENGRKLWSAQIGRNDEPSMAAVTNDDTVLTIIGPVAHAFNKFDGTPLFEYRLAAQPMSPPAMNDGAFFVPVAGGALYAYSLSVLEYHTRYGKLPDTVATPHMWRFICGEVIVHRPVLGERAVAFATEARNLFSVETKGSPPGKTRFQMVLNRPATADLAIADNKGGSSVLMLTGDNRVFSVDLMTGKTEWTYPMGRSMVEAPIVIGSEVFVVTKDGSLTMLDRDELSPSWGRPVEVPRYLAPMYIGAGMEDTAADSDVAGVVVKNIVPGSPAEMAGLLPGDIIRRIDGLEVTNVDSARNTLSELPRKAPRPVLVSRSGAVERLELRIPTTDWDVRGIEAITAIGRFAVFGIDQANRLVALDKRDGSNLGRVNIQGYGVRHHNAVTDQIYLVSSSGEVVCLREIGPTVKMPELSSLARHAKVISVKVQRGSAIEPTGTVICEVELPDGTTQPLSSSHKGAVREIYVTEGQVVNVDDPLIQISDDQFATYHQKPQQRPIDVELLDPNAVSPADAE